jgi:hypothetical protein
MGHLLYGRPPEKIEIEDRTLAHVKVVMLAKLRRGEAFAFSFEHDMSVGGGRSTIWVQPTIPLQFNFVGSRQPTLNRAWLDALIVSANSIDGLRLIEEPSETRAAAEPVPAAVVAK